MFGGNKNNYEELINNSHPLDMICWLIYVPCFSRKDVVNAVNEKRKNALGSDSEDEDAGGKDWV